MNDSWKPTASQTARKARANLLREIRKFFDNRGVLEVETPVLSQNTVTDCHIDSFDTSYLASHKQQTYFLQTSPEYAMKRLLAAGSGAIYQISRVFRQGESGRLHNPEFSMLEWYRPDFNYFDLMSEIDVLLAVILKFPKPDRISYSNLFLDNLNINPILATIDDLRELAKEHQLENTESIDDRDTLLDFIFSHLLQPQLAEKQPCYIYDYPSTQAALAQVKDSDPPVAQRFELYYRGIELANGFYELSCSTEQMSRFENDLIKRRKHRKQLLNIDMRFIDALKSGLPECSGVAMGIDRLLMLKLGATHIHEVINFPWHIA